MLVTLTFASWNQICQWFKQLEALRQVALSTHRLFITDYVERHTHMEAGLFSAFCRTGAGVDNPTVANRLANIGKRAEVVGRVAGKYHDIRSHFR